MKEIIHTQSIYHSHINRVFSKTIYRKWVIEHDEITHAGMYKNTERKRIMIYGTKKVSL